MFNLSRCSKNFYSPLLSSAPSFEFCESISIALSYAFFASSYLFCLDRASPLLFQASEFCGLISIALSNAFNASSYLFNLDRASPLLFQACESCGLISIALSYASIASCIYLDKKSNSFIVPSI